MRWKTPFATMAFCLRTSRYTISLTRRMSTVKAEDLIAKLRTIPPGSNVFLLTESGAHDFSGFSVDDNRDVQLYVAVGDKEA
jgi:hypothetical protein